VLSKSEFLSDFRRTAAGAMRGCIVLERPDLIRELVTRHRARDTTSRGTALAELGQLQPASSQWLPGHEVPEKHWLYWLAKKFWFNDFGAYREAKHDVQGRKKSLEQRWGRDASPVVAPKGN
jgi:hypothetical protein